MSLKQEFFKVADPAFARITQATQAFNDVSASNESFLARATKEFGEPTALRIEAEQGLTHNAL